MATIQIRNVPDDVHRVYQTRAAAAGQSLQEYLLGELVRNASVRSPAEVVAEVEQQLAIEGPDGFSTVPAADVVRADRDAH
jgi:plasmid stability protein